MPAGEGAESVIEKGFICLLTDSVVHEDPFGIEATGIVADAVRGDGGEIRLTAREEVGTRFAKEVLHALGGEEGEG